MLPSEWIVLDASWGEGKKHLYCPDAESLEWYPDYAAAEDGARKSIEDGSKMVAICHVSKLFVAKAAEYETVT